MQVILLVICKGFKIDFSSFMKRTNNITPTDVIKLQTAHFTDFAPYWYISSILQLPQFTCATWFANIQHARDTRVTHIETVLT